MSNSKFTTYLFYAIGEIVLVVIGIILAIQLNNWNSSRKQVIENELLMHNLLEDLAQDTLRMGVITEIDTTYISLKTASENCLKAMELSYLPLDSILIDSLFSLTLTAGLPLLNTETTIYEQLKETGRLYTLGSDELRRQIIEYYTDAKKEAQYNDGNNETIKQQMERLDFRSDYIINWNYNPHFRIQDYPWIFDPKSRELREFRLAIGNIYSSQRLNYSKWTQLHRQAKELISEINQELTK